MSGKKYIELEFYCDNIDQRHSDFYFQIETKELDKIIDRIVKKIVRELKNDR